MAIGQFGRWIGAFTLAIGLSAAASAQTRVAVGASANPDVAALFVAKDEGMFQKNGLDVSIVIIALNPTLPASLVSQSLQIGATTPTVFLQATDNGLDLATVAGVSLVTPNMQSVAVLARSDSTITRAQDFAGKTIAVPGLNAILHVALKLWLQKNGVDPDRVNYVEAPFPGMGDLLKGRQIDGAISVDPFMTRTEKAGIARRIAPFLAETLAGHQTMYYASTHEWAAQNPAAVKGFRAGLTEAAAFIAAQPDKTREIVNRYMKLPPEASQTLAMPATQVSIDPSDLVFFGDVLKKFGLVSNAVDPAKLMIP